MIKQRLVVVYLRRVDLFLGAGASGSGSSTGAAGSSSARATAAVVAVVESAAMVSAGSPESAVLVMVVVVVEVAVVVVVAVVIVVEVVSSIMTTEAETTTADNAGADGCCSCCCNSSAVADAAEAMESSGNASTGADNNDDDDDDDDDDSGNGNGNGASISMRVAGCSSCGGHSLIYRTLLQRMITSPRVPANLPFRNSSALVRWRFIYASLDMRRPLYSMPHLRRMMTIWPVNDARNGLGLTGCCGPAAASGVDVVIIAREPAADDMIECARNLASRKMGEGPKKKRGRTKQGEHCCSRPAAGGGAVGKILSCPVAFLSFG